MENQPQNKDLDYDINKPWLTLDNWQKEYIEASGNCFLLCGRQSGKTTAASIKFGKLAATKDNRIILMLAYTEKQAYNLFFKTLMYIKAVYPKMINRKKDMKPTKHVINLTNGSIIMCYAAGLTGEGIRTYTVTNLVIDEAAPMAREVFIATTPMLSVTRGHLDILSTPRGKAGYFYECSLKDNFTKFYVNAEDCPRHDPEHLKNERETMSDLEYAQEYKAQFLDDLRRLFSDDLIKACCKGKRENFNELGKYYLGVDVARYGKDESTFQIVDMRDKNRLVHIESKTTKKTLTTETTKWILFYNRIFNFKQIFIDAFGLGVGVFDQLLGESSTANKVIAINHFARPLDDEEKRKRTVTKEDIYNNLVNLMERGKIVLLDDEEVKLSLASAQWEDVNGKVRIFGNYMHIVDGITRAAWCSHTKHLNLWCAYN